MSASTWCSHTSHALRFSILLALGLVLSILASPAAGQSQWFERRALDLAAIALTPADVDEADLEWQGSTDYAHQSSALLFPAAYGELVGESILASETKIAEALTQAGLMRAHEMVMTPRTVADGDADRAIASYVVEYANRDGASDAWTFLRDQRAIGEVLEDSRLDEFTEASHAVLVEVEDTVILEMTVLVGRLHLGVTLWDRGGTAPGMEDAMALTRALVENAEDSQQSRTLGLSNQVVRLTGDAVETTSDTYTLRKGRVISLASDNADPEEIETNVAGMGLTDDYRVWQELTPGTDDQGEVSVYYLSVMQFVDDHAASVWLADRPDAIESYESFTDVEFVPENEVEYGDAAFSYTAESVDTGTHFHNITFRVDDQIVILDVSGPTTAPVAAITPLVEAQLACLEARQCLEPMELPEALEDFVEGRRS